MQGNEPSDLGDIERRLAQARPRAAAFDAFDVLRGVPTPPAPRVGGAHRSARYRAAALATASWACGVAVGAMVTLAVLERKPPTTASTDKTASTDNVASTDKAVQAAPSPSSVPALSRPVAASTDVSLLAQLNEWPEGMQLTAGMRRIPKATSVSVAKRPHIELAAPASIAPRAPVTREQLLEEILGELNGPTRPSEGQHNG